MRNNRFRGYTCTLAHGVRRAGCARAASERRALAPWGAAPMSQNPYANPYPQQYAQPYPPGMSMGPPARTSIMAVLSLIFSLLCCTAPLGVLFGGVALLAIAFSGGKVKGMGLAIAGLIIGIIVTVVLLGSAFAAVTGLTLIAQPASSAISSIESGDANAARTVFSAGSQATITDERLEEFRGIMSDDLGTFDHAPDGLGGWWSGYTGVFSNSTNGQAMEDASDQYNDDVVPVPMKFDGGWELVFIVLDQSGNTNSAGAPLYIDMGFVRDDGSIEWLVAGNDGNSTGLAPIPRMTPMTPADLTGEDPDEEAPAPTTGRNRPKP